MKKLLASDWDLRNFRSDDEGAETFFIRGWFMSLEEPGNRLLAYGVDSRPFIKATVEYVGFNSPNF